MVLIAANREPPATVGARHRLRAYVPPVCSRLRGSARRRRLQAHTATRLYRPPHRRYGSDYRRHCQPLPELWGDVTHPGASGTCAASRWAGLRRSVRGWRSSRGQGGHLGDQPRRPCSGIFWTTLRWAQRYATVWRGCRCGGSIFKIALSLDGTPRYANLPKDLTQAQAVTCQFRVGHSLEYIDHAITDALSGTSVGAPAHLGPDPLGRIATARPRRQTHHEPEHLPRPLRLGSGDMGQ